MTTLYKALIGREADMSLLRAVGARAFVHISRHIRRRLTIWLGRETVSHRQDTKVYPLHNPVTHSVVDSSNGTSLTEGFTAGRPLLRL